MNKYQNICAIWKNKDKNGNTYLSMKIEKDLKAGEKINIFQNDKKGVESRPDFRAYEVLTEVDQMMSDEEVEKTNNDVPF